MEASLSARCTPLWLSPHYTRTAAQYELLVGAASHRVASPRYAHGELSREDVVHLCGIAERKQSKRVPRTLHHGPAFHRAYLRKALLFGRRPRPAPAREAVRARRRLPNAGIPGRASPAPARSRASPEPSSMAHERRVPPHSAHPVTNKKTMGGPPDLFTSECSLQTQ